MIRKILTTLLMTCLAATVNINIGKSVQAAQKKTQKHIKVKELDRKYQDWFDLVHYLITPMEKDIFLKLTNNRDRDSCQFDANDYYQIYEELVKLSPGVAEVSLSLIPREGERYFSPSFQGPILHLNFVHLALLPERISVDYSADADKYYFNFNLLVVLKKGEDVVFQKEEVKNDKKKK